MKIIKSLMFAFVVSAAISYIGINAVVYRAYINYVIPINSIAKSLGYLDKTDENSHVLGVKSVTGDRDVMVQLVGPGVLGTSGASPWQRIEIPGTKQENGFISVENIDPGRTLYGYGLYPGKVFMFMKTRISVSSESFFTGTWYVSTAVY